MARRGGPITRLKRLASDTARLIHTLSRLTVAELRANVGQLRAPLVMLGAAAALALVALVLLVTTLVLGLAELVGALAASAIMTLIVAVAAWALLRGALSRLGRVDLAPRRSIATLQAQIDRFTVKRSVAEDVAHDPDRHD